MRIKIRSDGSPYGCDVIDAETGETMENVTAVHWEHRAGELPKVTIDLLFVDVDVAGDAPGISEANAGAEEDADDPAHG